MRAIIGKKSSYLPPTILILFAISSHSMPSHSIRKLRGLLRVAHQDERISSKSPSYHSTATGEIVPQLDIASYSRVLLMNNSYEKRIHDVHL